MRRLFTFAILLLAGAQGKAQNYIPFPDSNAIWTERHGNSEAPADIHTYGLKNSDTVFNSITYHKLYFSNDSVLDDNEFWAGLRQDIAAKKVYLYIPGSAAETLLFDFSLQLGDNFHNNLTVSYIDSMLLGGVFRKRFTFTHINAGVVLNDQWVEGVGNTDVGGVFGYPSLQPTCDCATSTLCFMKDGQWIYHNSMHTSVTCFKPTAGIDEHVGNVSLVSVYPNPLTGNGHIRISQQNTFRSLDIYNMAGSKLRCYDVTGKTDIPVSSNDFPGGMYFYRLTGNNGNAVSGKLVVE